MRFYALVGLLALPLAGAFACASSSPDELPPGPSVSKGEAYFNDHVKAVFEESCSNCHANADNKYGAPVFLGNSTESYYDGLIERRDFVSCDVENSMLLLKGADPGHVGVPLAAGDVPMVEEWLGIEADERFGGVCTTAPTAPPQPPPEEPPPATSGAEPPPPQEPQALTGVTAMAMFGDCMSYTDWVDTGMPLVAQQTATYNNEQVPCYSCHQGSNSGLNYMPDPNDEAAVMEAFQKMRYMYPSFNLVRWTVNDTDGSFKDIVGSYRWRDKGQDGGDHPPYTLDATLLSYYQDFLDRTLAKFHTAVESGVACDPVAGDPPGL